MAFPLTPAGRFHTPEFIVREKDGVFVAIDRDRANWVCLNRSGLEILRTLPGKTVGGGRFRMRRRPDPLPR